MLNGGLRKAVLDISPVEFELKDGRKIKLKLNGAQLFKPAVSESVIPAPKITEKFPKECRVRQKTYKGKLVVQIGWSINNKSQLPLEKCVGEIPIMVFISDKSVHPQCSHFYLLLHVLRLALMGVT